MMKHLASEFGVFDDRALLNQSSNSATSSHFSRFKHCFQEVTWLSTQSIIGATQKRRERLGWTVLLPVLAGAGLVLVMAYGGC